MVGKNFLLFCIFFFKVSGWCPRSTRFQLDDCHPIYFFFGGLWEPLLFQVCLLSCRPSPWEQAGGEENQDPTIPGHQQVGAGGGRNSWLCRVPHQECSLFRWESKGIRNAGSLALLVKCLLQTGSWGQEKPHPLGHAHKMRMEEEGVGHGLRATDSLFLPSFVEFLEKKIFTCGVPPGQFPETLNGCLFVFSFHQFCLFHGRMDLWNYSHCHPGCWILNSHL